MLKEGTRVAVVIYAVGRSPLRSGVVVKFDGRGGVWIRIVRRSWHDHRRIAPGTVHIEALSRVVAVPHALKAAVTRELRQHVSRPPRPAELRRRERQALARNISACPNPMSEIVTPEMTLLEAGIDDARQAEYSAG
jgi:hypothetical protein